MEIKLEEKTSKKGNKYTCLAVYLSPTYVKYVFLNNAELELVKQHVNK